jgi:hypothetical protein
VAWGALSRKVAQRKRQSVRCDELQIAVLNLLPTQGSFREIEAKKVSQLSLRMHPRELSYAIGMLPDDF